MHLDLQNITELDIFKELSPDEVEMLLPIVHPVKIFEGERLIREGDVAQIFYVVISGNYLIYFKDGRAFTLNRKGDIIGWSTIASPFTYHENAVALTDGEALTIPLEDFLHLIQSNSNLSNKLTQKVAEIIRQRKAFIRNSHTDKTS